MFRRGSCCSTTALYHIPFPQCFVFTYKWRLLTVHRTEATSLRSAIPRRHLLQLSTPRFHLPLSHVQAAEAPSSRLKLAQYLH